MLDNNLPLISLFSSNIEEASAVQDIEEKLSGPLSNRKKLKLLQRIIRLSRNSVTPENYPVYAAWLDQVMDKLNHQTEQAGPDNSAFFSQHDDIREIVMKRLRSATTDLKICMFTISDDPIAETIAGCYKQGIRVRIITDDGKVFDKGSDIFSLARMGIQVKMDSFRSLMHHKFVIIDNQKLLTGSYNWTRTGADVNNENVLITSNSRIVKAYKKEFKRLWSATKPLPQ